MPSFYEKLTESIQTNNSLLCLGLDPDPMQYPEAFPNGHREISSVDWGTKLIEVVSISRAILYSKNPRGTAQTMRKRINQAR